MDLFPRDLTLALRALRRQPKFFVAAVLTLALGIGATTAVFSVAHATLLRPLPLRDPGRLMMVYLTPPPETRSRLAAQDLPDGSVRMALGATRGQVLRGVLTQTLLSRLRGP